MKTRIVKLALLTVVLATAVSGCASHSLKLSSDTPIPVGGNSPTAKSLDIQFGVARLLERNGKLEEARRGYLEILSLQSHAPSLHRLGVTAIRQNRLDAGLEHLSKAIAAGKPNAELLGDYGYAQLLSGDLLAAESTLKEAVSLDPSQKRNVNNLAIAIGKQDRLRESFQLFRQVNNESEALANLAFLQAQAEDLGKAKANYNRALELDPELEIAAIGLLEVHNHLESYGELNSPGARYSDAQFASHPPASPTLPVVQREPRSIEPTRQELPRPRVASSPPQATRAAAQPQPRLEAPAQQLPRRQRIVGSPPQPTHAAAQPQPAHAADRLLAAIKRPVQIPGRAPVDNHSSRIKRTKQVDSKLGPGTFQPPSFDQRSTGVILQASYEEPINQPPPAR